MKNYLHKMLFALLIACGVSFAANAQDMKIGVVDLHKVIQESAQVKAINQKLENQFKSRQQSIVAKQKQLKVDMDKINRDSAIMNEAQKSDLQSKIVTEKRDLSRLEQDYRQDVSMSQNKAMGKFFDKLKTIINDIAKKGDFDLILQKDGLPYFSDKIDITSRVVKQLS